MRLSPLDIAHVGPIKAAMGGERLLRVSTLAAELSDPCPKAPSEREASFILHRIRFTVAWPESEFVA